MDMKYAEITKEERIAELEKKLERAERNARMNQSRCDTWREYFRREERKNSSSYMEGIGVGLAIGCIATIIDMMFWKRLLK